MHSICVGLFNYMNEKDKKTLFLKEYSELFDYVYRYICFRVPQKEEAEDLVSEVFLQAYHRLSDFDAGKGNLRQWITGIAKNKLLMYWRRRVIHIDLDAIPERILSNNIHADFALDKTMLIERIFHDQCDDIKALLAFRYIDGLTYEEIALCVNKKPDSVRKFFSRLHKRLEETYKEHYDK